MQTLILEVTNQNALKALHSLEEKHYIKILDDTTLQSPALPGSPLTLDTFKNWISQSENSNSISLKAAKEKWGNKRKQLTKFTR